MENPNKVKKCDLPGVQSGSIFFICNRRMKFIAIEVLEGKDHQEIQSEGQLKDFCHSHSPGCPFSSG
jgi:hypothetical protein